ncbi:hypothetical protein IWX46DRAFT_613816 [Phyllosticta citricarpa]|uniref:Uncharacterized protein n=1 Tax=Phyllosticta citricarpa TaxID=55181 RepID=A0ABR1LDN1_9PEZI
MYCEMLFAPILSQAAAAATGPGGASPGLDLPGPNSARLASRGRVAVPWPSPGVPVNSVTRRDEFLKHDRVGQSLSIWVFMPADCGFSGSIHSAEAAQSINGLARVAAAAAPSSISLSHLQNDGDNVLSSRGRPRCRMPEVVLVVCLRLHLSLCKCLRPAAIKERWLGCTPVWSK